MTINLAIAVLSGFVLYCYFQLQILHGNITKAKISGFKYVVLPFHMLSVPWALTRSLLLPVLDRLPENWTRGWVPYVVFELAFDERSLTLAH